MIPRLVILDRDDTLIRLPPDRTYVAGDDEIQFAPGAIDFIAALNAASVPVVVATNQQAIALPEFPDIALESVHCFYNRMQIALSAHRASTDRFYICPHAADAGCPCRKPRPGHFLQALHEFSVTPSQVLAIGDQARDLEAPHAAGIRSLFPLYSDPAPHDAPCRRLGARPVTSFAALQSELLPARR